MKPFSQWTDADVEAWNAKVGKKEVIATENRNSGTQVQRALPVQRVHGPTNDGSVETGGAKSDNNTRQFTNLVIQPSTDEQKLNKLERSWLRQLRLTHPEENIGVQSFTMKLGDDCRYTPDFWTLDANGQIHFWECKGFMRDDALVKIKAAARKYRLFRFVLVTKEKGQWVEKPINP